MINEPKIIRWGILGAGNIAHRFANSIQYMEGCKLEAISGRSQSKLNKFAEMFPCEKRYIKYNDLLEDPDVDAIYLSLPHGLHFEWATKALQKGKAVLCEKPATINESEMQQIAQISREQNILFMEAIKSRFEPAYIELKKEIEEGIIGDIEKIITKVCFMIPAGIYGKTYHTDPVQGGALLDSGIYCAGVIEDFLSGKPEINKINATYYNKIDYYVNANLQFDNGIGILEVGFDRVAPRNAVIYGSKGKIEVIDLHRPTNFIIYKENEEPYKVNVPYINDDFYGQIKHFMELLRDGKSESDIMPLSASIRCAHILDAIRDGYTKYDSSDLTILEKQEVELAYYQFTNADAFILGNTIVQLTEGPVAVRIIREKDQLVIYQHIMDGKSQKNIEYAERKRNTALSCSHSSAWAYIKNMVDGVDIDEKKGLLAGGAFPIFVNQEHVATVMVSGLHEGKDHELIVEAISKSINKEFTHFKKALG